MKCLTTLSLVCLALPAQEVPRQLTLYQGDLALLQETRTLTVQKGRNQLRIEGLPATFLPTTFTLFLPEGLRIHAQTHRPWNPDPALVLAPGRRVSVSSTGSAEDAVVVSRGDHGETVLQFRDRIEVMSPQAATRLSLPSLPENLTLAPGMDLILSSPSDGSIPVDLSCLFHGLSWSPEYTATFHPDQQTVDLTAWARLRNQTGMSFRDASVQLVAGSLPEAAATYEGVEFNHAPPPPPPLVTRLAGTVSRELGLGPTPGGPVTIGEHQRYTLPEKVTLPEVGATLVPFMDMHKVPVHKVYTAEVDTSEEMDRSEREERHVPIQAELVLANKTNVGLGQNLPNGTIRTFLQDSVGPRIYLGEGRFTHTLPGEDIKLSLGEASHLKVQVLTQERRLLADAQGKGAWEVAAFRVRLTHGGKDPHVVKIHCNVAGDFTVMGSSFPGTREGARTLVFSVPVEPGRSAELTFRLKIQKPRP